MNDIIAKLIFVNEDITKIYFSNNKMILTYNVKIQFCGFKKMNGFTFVNS